MSPLSEKQWTFLRTIASRIVPETEGLDAAAWGRFAAIIAKALEGRPPSIRRQFALFLDVIRWAPLPLFGRPFERLKAERQDAVLRCFMNAPLAKLRSGFWGLRVLVFMGYYGRPEVWPALRYAPSFRGNELLHG